jgi:hypothetical protein
MGQGRMVRGVSVSLSETKSLTMSILCAQVQTSPPIASGPWRRKRSQQRYPTFTPQQDCRGSLRRLPGLPLRMRIELYSGHTREWCRPLGVGQGPN